MRLSGAEFRARDWPTVGMVTCVGHRPSEVGFSDAELLRASVLGLRRLGNADPVIAFHVDSELSERDYSLLTDEALGYLSIVDVVEVADESDRNAVNGDLRSAFRSYYCLNFAMSHSPFEATMLTNSDTLFFVDPAQWWKALNLQTSR